VSAGKCKFCKAKKIRIEIYSLGSNLILIFLNYKKIVSWNCFFRELTTTDMEYSSFSSQTWKESESSVLPCTIVKS